MEPKLLLERLDSIARSLERSRYALALIALGSVGRELERLDAYSDLDFFVVVEAGHKRAYLDDLGWLERVHPVAFAFANTADGYKLLFADGILCEMAVFEMDELPTIPYAPGRIVWKQPHVPDSISVPAVAPPVPTRRDTGWLLGEALTNLLVGVMRERRGEKLSAARFIQGYAVDRVVELAEEIEPPRGNPGDAFARERRFEQRHPEIAGRMGDFVQGYERNCESALAILAFLEQHFAVNAAVAGAIRSYCEA